MHLPRCSPPRPLCSPLIRRLRASLALGLTLGCGAFTPQPAPAVFPLLAGDSDGCADAVTRIEAVDEPTPLGFAAIDVLMRLAGPRSSPLVWLEPAPNPEYLLTLGPERGVSTLQIDVRAGEGPILHRFRTPLLMAPDDTTCDAGALEIPVVVTLESAAQGLSESFDAVLQARVPYRGHIEKQLAPGALRGSLGLASVTSLDPARSFWLGPMRLEADIWQGGSLGALSVAIGASHAKPADELRLPPQPPAQPGSIVAWPSAAACEDGGNALPSDAKVLGFSVDDVIAELRASGVRRATWSDGSDAQLELELVLETPEPCQRVGESLSFGATLRARSAAGIDVRSAVRVDALDAGGSVGAISIESAEPDADSPVAGGARGTGESLARDSGVLVGVEWTHDGARDTGSLSLRSVDASRALASARW
jgi:hypothetical protein